MWCSRWRGGSAAGGAAPRAQPINSDHQTQRSPRRQPHKLINRTAKPPPISAPPKPARSCAMNGNNGGCADSNVPASMPRNPKSVGTKTDVSPTVEMPE